jgi:hypothetical protein
MIARLSRPDAVSLFATQAEGPSTSELMREADRLRQRLDGLAEAYADGALTASQLRKGSVRLRTVLADVEGRLAEVNGIPKAARAVVSAEDVRAVWEGLEIEQQRAVIGALAVVRLDAPGRGSWVFRPETVRIEWRGRS